MPKERRLLGYFPVLSPNSIAAVTLTGLILDALGGLYLAYDLLGQERGPLRAVTRAATYALIYGLGYGLPLGLMFGIVAGIGVGGTIGFEFWRASRRNHGPNFSERMLFSVCRGATVGLAAGLVFNWKFGLVFGLVVAAGLSITYIFRLSPSDVYVTAGQTVLSHIQLSASVARGLLSILAGTVAGLLLHSESQALAFGVRLGLVGGVVSATMSIVTPFIEWWAEHVPARRMGTIGVLLIVLGFLLQSVQYLLVLFTRSS